MMTNPEIEAARRASIAAKARLMTRLDMAKTRLSPAALADTAVEGAKSRAFAFALDRLDALRRRPAVIAALAGAIGVVLAGRPKLARAMQLALASMQPGEPPRVAPVKRAAAKRANPKRQRARKKEPTDG